MKKYLYIWLVAFLFNLLWEFAHATLYTVNGQPVALFRLLQSTFGDAWIVLGLFVLFAAVIGDSGWYRALTKGRITVLALLGGIIALAIEINAIYYAHRWAYTAAMPTVFGIGVTPVLQMMILPTLTFLTVALLSRRKG